MPDGARPLAMVTGPTAGIGRSFAHALAERGYDLVLVARDRDRLAAFADELRGRHGTNSEVLPADLVDRDDLALVEARLAATARPVDLLVNNAGFGLKKQFLDNTVDDEQAMLDVLVVAVMRLTHAALHSMVQRGSGGVINVSSVSAYTLRGSYSAAKAYVTHLSRWADVAYRDRGVRVMAVAPGFTRTEFHQRMDVGRGSAPSWMWLDADKVVNEALRDFDRGRAVSVPDPRYKAIVTLAKLTPPRLARRFQTIGRR